MPGLAVPDNGVPAVAEFGLLLLTLLDEAESIKATAQMEPPLTSADFEDLKPRVQSMFGDQHLKENTLQYPIVETAARDIFYQLIASTKIESPEFVKVWNLLDILTILSDSELCDAQIVFWFIEELLDSQTIQGCRTVFDFLESRRERLTAKNFRTKNLVILRSCNELLRRLSRAQDTSFCGRVFIFLFQSFPLGDKSSVNLRGEYHVENVTTYDQPQDGTTDAMDVDGDSSAPKNATVSSTAADQPSAGKEKSSIDTDSLYPIFWSLQDTFSQPKKLFDKAQLNKFKKSMEVTVKAMKAHSIHQGPRQAKSSEEPKQDVKKKSSDNQDLSNTFNPKYLTSRDLFDLEINDMSFQRHVLVQALILMDFLISLSEPERKKRSVLKTPNKSVLYPDQTLGVEDTQWAVDMRRTIQDFLIEGPEGAFFYRMVDTILTRDKNWVRWKLESCPPIEIPAMSAETFAKSKATIEAQTSKRPKQALGGPMSFDFLKPEDEETMWKKYEDPTRAKLPDLKTFERKIADAKFDVDIATDPDAKAEAEEVLAAQTWRALRIVGQTNIALFDKIDDYHNVDVIFKDHADEEEEEEEEEMGEKAQLPEDTRPLVLSGPSGVETTSLVTLLVEKKPGAFKLVPRLCSRKQADGENQGDEFDFVPKADIDAAMERDQIIEFEDVDGATYATNRSKVDAVRESGKVPVLCLGPSSAQQIKDWDYSARFLFIAPASFEDLQTHFKKDPSLTDEKVSNLLSTASEQVSGAKKPESIFEKVITKGAQLEDACTVLIEHVYGGESEVKKEDKKEETEGQDVEMKD